MSDMECGGGRSHPPPLGFDHAHIESVVFSGGGVRGVAFCGALMALRALFPPPQDDPLPPILPNLKRAAGTSVGAIFACACALRVSSERLFQLLDSEAILEGLAPKVDLNQLHRSYGLDTTQRLREGVQRVLEIGLPPWGVESDRAATLTMEQLCDLTGVDVSVCTTRVGGVAPGVADLPESEILSPHSTPRLPVVDALVMSMAVPVLYQPTYVNAFVT